MVKAKFPSPKLAEQSLEYGGLRASKGVQTDPPPKISTSEVQTMVCISPRDAGTRVELEALSVEFSQFCHEELGIDIPDNFLVHAGAAMVQLGKSNRSNILYTLAKGIGSMREDQSDSQFPTKRMPLGLVEYMANFFAAESINQVGLLWHSSNVHTIIQYYRFHGAQMITECGCKLCTVSLAKTTPWPYVVCGTLDRFSE